MPFVDWQAKVIFQIDGYNVVERVVITFSTNITPPLKNPWGCEEDTQDENSISLSTRRGALRCTNLFCVTLNASRIPHYEVELAVAYCDLYSLLILSLADCCFSRIIIHHTRRRSITRPPIHHQRIVHIVASLF